MHVRREVRASGTNFFRTCNSSSDWVEGISNFINIFFIPDVTLNCAYFLSVFAFHWQTVPSHPLGTNSNELLLFTMKNTLFNGDYRVRYNLRLRGLRQVPNARPAIEGQ